MPFKKVTKKYELVDSYFKKKVVGMPKPATPFEVMEYHNEHNELPFVYEGENWVYDCFIEYQKRKGIENSQFFTPAKTAARMAELLQQYAFVCGELNAVLDACCGFGMLSKACIEAGFFPQGFDVDSRFASMYEYMTEGCEFSHQGFDEVVERWNYDVIANPPYEIKECTEFLLSLDKIVCVGAYIVLLLPKGFIDKQTPKRTKEAVSAFKVLHREDMQEPFAHTPTKAEIVVLQKYDELPF